MLKEVKVFHVEPIGNSPSLDDCYDAVDIAIKNNCFVRMEWYVKYSGHYHKLIGTSDDAKTVYDSLPKIYGV